MYWVDFACGWRESLVIAILFVISRPVILPELPVKPELIHRPRCDLLNVCPDCHLVITHDIPSVLFAAVPRSNPIQIKSQAFDTELSNTEILDSGFELIVEPLDQTSGNIKSAKLRQTHLLSETWALVRTSTEATLYPALKLPT